MSRPKGWHGRPRCPAPLPLDTVHRKPLGPSSRSRKLLGCQWSAGSVALGVCMCVNAVHRLSGLEKAALVGTGHL